jgi:hypothetical protein
MILQRARFMSPAESEPRISAYCSSAGIAVWRALDDAQFEFPDACEQLSRAMAVADSNTVNAKCFDSG